MQDFGKQKVRSKLSITASTAVILAAGTGSRLLPYTETIPKCLVPVNKVPILKNTLIILSECGITNVIIVVGHYKEKIMEVIGDEFRDMKITYIESERYRTTNNIYSLWLAREYLTDDLLLLEADIYFEKNLIDRILNYPGENAMAVIKYHPWMSGTVISTDRYNMVNTIIESRYQDLAFNYNDFHKTANIYRLDGSFLQEYFLPLLDNAVMSGNVHSYYESILSELRSDNKLKMNAVHCDDLKCIEIDNENDLLKAEFLFSDKEQQYEYISGLFGDYWRYDFKDYNFLYNLFFPPESLTDDISENIRNIALNYPSGQDHISGLLGILINQPKERIVVGNGASELIKVICQTAGGKITVPVPTFNEWVNAVPASLVYESPINGPSFELDVEKVLHDAVRFGSNTVVVVNPNNPTSLITGKSEVLYLSERLEERNITLIMDESFIDFADDNSSISMANEIERFSNLVIIKSMSKCYGIGGLRLGYVLSNNKKLIRNIKENIPIWNINGFAEAFLRLAPQYQNEFHTSCDMVRKVRDDLYAKLQKIRGLKVYKPSANFVFCKLPGNLSGIDVAKQLFINDNILVKHCGGKNMPDGDNYLRIACRDKIDNNILVNALKEGIIQLTDGN